MGVILQSLSRTVIAGLVLLGVIFALVSGIYQRTPVFDHQWVTFFMRWLHVMSGMMWLGLLWYFNFVQFPVIPQIPDEQRPAITKIITAQALFWFRWAALATVITGVLLALMNRYLLQALQLQEPVHAIGIGMWLALLMACNVWFILWPNQKKALGIVPADATEKARAARTAMLTSRLNTLLSIPMLFCMVAQHHGGF